VKEYLANPDAFASAAPAAAASTSEAPKEEAKVEEEEESDEDMVSDGLPLGRPQCLTHVLGSRSLRLKEESDILPSPIVVSYVLRVYLNLTVLARPVTSCNAGKRTKPRSSAGFAEIRSISPVTKPIKR
jgi:60s Acidic ribosomal protein